MSHSHLNHAGSFGNDTAADQLRTVRQLGAVNMITAYRVRRLDPAEIHRTLLPAVRDDESGLLAAARTVESIMMSPRRG